MAEESRAKESQRAIPPPDNPLLRHEELNTDREFGREGKSFADLRLAALQHAQTMPTLVSGAEGVPPLFH